jgi:phosphatidylserine/phosphatidylglycerophosphate/cardiolipin synthase-like enzyme
VTVSGAKGTVSQESGDATVARAVADAPDPQAIERLESLMETVSDEPLFKDNEVRLLVDGPETYAAMLAAIGAAKHHVHLETYIFNEDLVGDRFAAALLEKSAAGVDVRVIYDSLGSRERMPCASAFAGISGRRSSSASSVRENAKTASPSASRRDRLTIRCSSSAAVSRCLAMSAFSSVQEIIPRFQHHTAFRRTAH